MANSTLTLSPQALLGVLLAESGRPLPAMTWPIDVALGQLAAMKEDLPALSSALARLELGRRPGREFPGVRDSIERLVRAGSLRPTGRGWDARFEASDTFVLESKRLGAQLSAHERVSVRRAAQRFVAMSTMASKKVVA